MTPEEIINTIEENYWQLVPCSELNGTDERVLWEVRECAMDGDEPKIIGQGLTIEAAVRDATLPPNDPRKSDYDPPREPVYINEYAELYYGGAK